MKKYVYETRMEVRDYECDIEGIVNNANYLHYTEHTRHRFLKHAGLSFVQMHEKGVDAVVARMNLAYKTPLRCKRMASVMSLHMIFFGRVTSDFAFMLRLNWCA